MRFIDRQVADVYGCGTEGPGTMANRTRPAVRS